MLGTAKRTGDWCKKYNISAQRIHFSLEFFFARLAHVLEQLDKGP